MAKTQQYEQEIKEKNLLIGKLRHEGKPSIVTIKTLLLTMCYRLAIILNEHLIEAMRRLKEETSDSNVDRQVGIIV